MNRKEVKDFFNKYAEKWDNNMVCDNKKVETIFNHANIKENIDVLDVGCGTGVLFDYYLKKKVKSVKAIDISEEMIKIAKNKYINSNINIECIDAYKFNTGKYDAIMMYDCFPHFDNQELIIKHLSTLLNKDGYLTVAHSMSREKLKEHHKNIKNISLDPIHEIELEKIMNKYGTVTSIISNKDMFLLTMKK